MTDEPDIITIAGAGLAGTLLSILLAKRGQPVRLYERLPDLRREPIDAGRSINLALAARGIRALEAAGVMAQVQPLLIPMPGRLVHDTQGARTFIAYGQRPAEVIYSVSRPGLNCVLLDAAAAAGVDIRFRHSIVGADIDQGTVRVRDDTRQVETPLPLRRVIAADGAGSVLRRSLVAQRPIACSEDLLEHGYKELTLPAADGRHQLDANALHLWPRGGFMLIALPNTDGSFTVTLFLANRGAISFDSLNSAERVAAFFATHFPDVAALMPNLAREFFEHPIGVMGTVRCEQWALDERLLLIGDAAHAITPFHGQGMNCAFEDCREFDRLFGEHQDWAAACTAFQALRRHDTDAIAAISIENYLEMRDTVRAPNFQLQKALSLELERRFPDRFVPRYSMVMFHDEIPYAVAYARGVVQARILDALTHTAHSLAEIDYEAAALMIHRELPPLSA